MSTNIDTEKRVLRPFTRRGHATNDPVVPNGLTVVSLWDPAVPEGLNEGDDYWRDGQILILTGEMADQQREVTGFVQATGTLTVAPRFVNPVATLLTVNSPAGDLVIDVASAAGFTAGSLLTADAPLGDLVIDVVDASIFRVGNAVIWDNTPASEMVVITNVNLLTNQLTLVGPGITLAAGYLVANDAVISMQSDAYIWDDAGAESVTVLGVDEVLNQLTIAPPGIIAALGYNLVDNAAISRSPAILDGVEFVLMPPTRTVDTGEHTNPMTPEEPYWLVSDKDTHFTGAIAQDAEEDEDLVGLAANKIVITDVAFEGKENLQFRLIFWSKDTFEDADLDVDAFLGFVDLDIPNNGFQKGGAGQWYLNLTDVNLNYEDEDASQELHVSLNCVSAAGKTAGVPGEVKIKVCYKVRE